MKKFKSLLSVTLSILMVISCMAPAGAIDIWDIYWQNEAEAQMGAIMQPGRTEEERNFSWYMPKEVTSCAVEIATNPLMLNSESFSGNIIKSYQGDNVAKVTIDGLEKGETYYYTLVSGAEKSSVYSFDTVEADSFSALYVSDIHVSYDEAKPDELKTTSFAFADLLTEAKTRSDINIILSAGDQASLGLRSEYQGLTFSPVSRGLTFATSIGNHDRKNIDYKYFKNVPNEKEGMIASPQGGDYYFVKGEVLFLFIDSNNPSTTDHRNFIDEAVKANSDVKWRVAVMHHDLYGGSIPHREGENKLLRTLYSPIFDEFNIDLVLLGHSHHYSVTDVVYNGKSVEKVENGKTITNAKGTVYMVSSSVTRPRENDNIQYGDLVAFGMEDYTQNLYTIIDFSAEEIEINIYEKGQLEEKASFSLAKEDDYKAPQINFFRKVVGMFLSALGTIVAVFNNIGQYNDLTEKGLELNFFEVLF